MATLKNTTINDTTSLTIPSGTTRPSSPSQGSLFYNTSTSRTEYYDGTNWKDLYDSFPKARGGVWYDIEENGVPYRVHVFTTRGFAYTSRNSAASLGFNDTENLIQNEVRGEVDALPGGCSGAITFEQALAWVHDDGARLITRREYYNRVAEGTGCGYDAQMCWTCDKSDQDGNRHWTHIGDWNSSGWSYNDEANTSAHELRYGADVDPNRDDPVFLSDKFMFDWLKTNYPNDFTGDKLIVEQGGEVEYMLVAGGGGGGPTDGSGAAGGGGGAGGLLTGKLILQPGTYNISVGAGGTGDRTIFGQEYGQNGGNTTAFGLTAIGGGGGGSRDVTGRNGGSGGGDNRTNGTSGAGTAGQGFAGGGGGNNVSPSAGGGGGGATELGENVYSRTDNSGGQYYAGKGGNGRFTTIIGTPTFFAGGGGGGDGLNDLSGAMGGQGGFGGGGAGGDGPHSSGSRAWPGYDAGFATGGGGGGTAGTSTKAGDGGDGIVIVRYRKQPSFDNPYNGITTRNLMFNLDAADIASFQGRRNDYYYWYELEQNIRGTINGEVRIENPASIQAAPQFDGNNKYVRFELNQPFQLWGLEAWVRFDYAVPNNDTAIGGPTTYQTLIGYNGNQQIVSFGAWTGTATNEAVHIWNGSTMTYNRDYVQPGWHHLFFRWNGNTYDIFVDGFKTQTYARTSGHATILEGINYIDVGGNISAVYMFQGKIPVVRIYNGEITEEEVRRNFNALRWRYDV